ncbi:MAG: DNA adenine methylase [Epsilonproteobacteria bacterium]|nr:DNA adenine methylase [Campylobacterota bacterium]
MTYSLFKIAKPFVKWAGGKRQLIPELLKYIPGNFNNYFEPFAGGGALFFELYNLGILKDKQVFLFDNNKELINSYEVIKNAPYELIEKLKEFKSKHNKYFYYQIRELDRSANYKTLDKITKAARFIYLNKTCFNGLYRVNKKGYFNVPMGSYKDPKIVDENNILLASKALQNTTIKHCDYKDVLHYTQKNDFIYFDPPYFPLNKTSNFTSYTQGDFLEKEQIELFNTFNTLSQKGCFVLQSNSDTDFINNLYKNFKIQKILANRAINSKGNKRGKITEVLIRNY